MSIVETDVVAKKTIAALRRRASARGLKLVHAGDFLWRITNGKEKDLLFFGRGKGEDINWSRHDPCSHWSCNCHQMTYPNPTYWASAPLTVEQIEEYLGDFPTTKATDDASDVWKVWAG